MRLLALLLLFVLCPLAAHAAASANTMVLMTPVDVTCATTGTLLAGLNRRRAYLLLVNRGTDTVFLAPNSVPGSTAPTVPLLASQSIVWEVQAPQNAIYCIANSSTQDVRVWEGQ